MLVLTDARCNSVLCLSGWPDCDDRVLKVGDLVWKKINALDARSRVKTDPFWHDLSRVTERVGAKTHHVFKDVASEDAKSMVWHQAFWVDLPKTATPLNLLRFGGSQSLLALDPEFE